MNSLLFQDCPVEHKDALIHADFQENNTTPYIYISIYLNETIIHKYKLIVNLNNMDMDRTGKSFYVSKILVLFIHKMQDLMQ